MPIDMNFRMLSPSRRVLSLAILAMIFHGLMPLLMAFPAPAEVRMEMCTVWGAKTYLARLDSSGQGLPDKDLQTRCPICLASAITALLPAEASPALLSGLTYATPPQLAGSGAAVLDWPKYRSRAPPFFR